jgi:hypothetical protein
LTAREAEYRGAWKLCRDEYAELEGEMAVLKAREEHLLHGICDALNTMPMREQSATKAILRSLLKGTDHEGHADG